ncbi:hypothetical protein ABZZ16_15065 [Streptomyces sp. NPDC006386]|uniref:hypothetical protein n=1 Tax=Streptomyces sp. NPDC006386 TaxID=3156762 RepID=UPI0033BA6954
MQRHSKLTVDASPEPVKTIKSNSTGNLTTTVTASTDGYFRYGFAGTATTPAVNATGDFGDVR